MTKKKQSQNKMSANPKNLHVVDFKKKKTKKKTTPKVIPEANTPEFDGLAQKLNRRINLIESDLKDGIQILEEDVQKLIKKNKSGDLESEINQLAKMLESRVKKSVDNLVSPSLSNYDKEELKLVKSLTTQLVKILSFDFYKNVINKLNKEQQETEVDEFGMDPIVIQKIKPFVDYLYYKYWRVKTTGIENIPNDGRGLIVGNHSGTLPYDGSMLAAAIYNEHPVRKDARFLVENFVFHMPMLGSFMYRIGGVRACPENAQRLLEKEHLVIVFPEGVKGIGKYYTERYKLQRFGRGGFIKLCLKTNSPVIPVGIVGAEEIHPIVHKSNMLAKTIGVPYIPITPTFPLLGLLGIIPFPTKWSIHFGSPISFKKLPKDTIDNDLQIHKLSENVRNEIQKILIELLKQRRSIWLG